jgi:hypothetical protein
VGVYRLYCLDGAGKIAAGEWVEADADDEAVRIARGMNKPVPCELWQRTRFVAHIQAVASPDANGASPPPSFSLRNDFRGGGHG